MVYKVNSTKPLGSQEVLLGVTCCTALETDLADGVGLLREVLSRPIKTPTAVNIPMIRVAMVNVMMKIIILYLEDIHSQYTVFLANNFFLN